MSRVQAECALCGSVLTPENDSEEHVLLNAVGGRLKVRRFLCKSCNDTTGHSWDAELARQLNALCLLIGVERERGETPSMVVSTTANEKLRITAKDGLFPAKPTYEVRDTPHGKQLHFTARTMSEAQRMLRKAKTKYPRMDMETALAQLKPNWSRPEGYVHHSFEVGGPMANRSIVKSALAFAHHCGLRASECKDAIVFLRDSFAEPAPLGWYFDNDVLIGRPTDIPVTCVGLDTDPDTGLALAYVEFFGVHRAIVCLSSDYTGPKVRSVYGFDPRTAMRLPLQIELRFDKTELSAIYAYERVPDGALEAAFTPILQQALKRQTEQDRERVFEAAVNYGFANCGAQVGEVITEDQARRMAALVTDWLTPWIVQQLRRPSAGTPPPFPLPAADAETEND